MQDVQIDAIKFRDVPMKLDKLVKIDDL